MSASPICGITVSHIDQIRSKAKDAGKVLSERFTASDEVAQVRAVYELIILSHEFQDALCKHLQLPSVDDVQFKSVIEQIEREAEAIIWMYYHPDMQNFLHSRFSVAKMVSQNASHYVSQKPTVFNMITRDYTQLVSPVAVHYINEYIIGNKQPLESIRKVKDFWNSKKSAATPASNFNHSSDEEYAEQIRSIGDQAMSEWRLDYNERLLNLKRTIDHRLRTSSVIPLKNGLPYFPFVHPVGVFKSDLFDKARQLKDDPSLDDETKYVIEDFRNDFMTMTFKPPPAQEQTKTEEMEEPEKAEEKESDEDSSSEEDDSEEEDESEEEEVEENPSPPTSPIQPSSPPPTTTKPPSPPPQEAEDNSEGSPPRGTGRHNARNWRRKRDHSSEREDDEPPTSSKSTDQQGDKRSESPTSDQDDIEEHFLDDLHERSKEYIDQFNNWDKLPEPYDHSKRFGVNDDTPQEINAADLNDDDIIISLNDSSRSVRFVLTFVETTRKPVFNRILDPRRNRKS
jgi:hypothetical protein